MESQQRGYFAIDERRRDVRFSGKSVEGVQILLFNTESSPGWDQSDSWQGKVSNISAGGIEVLLGKTSNPAVDQRLQVQVKFPWDHAEIVVPGIVRHLHPIEGGSMVGIQYLWKNSHPADEDLEYLYCDQLLRCSRSR